MNDDKAFWTAVRRALLLIADAIKTHKLDASEPQKDGKKAA